MNFSKFAEDVNRHGLPDWMDDDRNPFFNENDRVYIKYDSLKMENFSDLVEGVKLTFGYMGQDICYQRIECKQVFKNNNEFTLYPIYGKMEVDIKL